MEWDTLSIRYSFKEGSFYAVVTTAKDANIVFLVDRDNNGQLEDNYVSANWKAEIMEDCLREVEELFEIQVLVFVDIHDTGKELVQNSTNIPHYSEVSRVLAPKTQITFKGDFTEKQLASIVKVTKWIVGKKYVSNVSFISDDMFIDIPYQSLGTIQTEADIDRFRLR